MDEKRPGIGKEEEDGKPRAQPRAQKPGAVSVAGDEASRLDQRIAEKRGDGNLKPSPNEQLSDVQAKLQARNERNEAGMSPKPGATQVSARDQLEGLEDAVNAKQRAAVPGAQAALNQLEDRIAAKTRQFGGQQAHQDQGRAALQSLEDRISSKMSANPAPSGVTPGARAELQGLEDSVAAKQRAVGVHSLDQLDERIAAKAGVAGAHAAGYDDTMDRKMPAIAKDSSVAGVAQLAGHAGMKKGDGMGGVEAGFEKKGDIPSEKAPEKMGMDNGMDDMEPPRRAGGLMDDSDLEFGGYDPQDNPDGLAVAVPIQEDEDVFIPAAVEYDPDAKPPVYQNRRFKLYAVLAALVLIVVAVGAGVGIGLGKDSPPSPTSATYRESIGIRAAVESVIGEKKLSNEQGPYSKALRWMTYSDPMMLTPDDPSFIQRFIVVYLYYATTARKPWRSCNPPGDDGDTTCVYQRASGTGDKLEFKPVTGSVRWLSKHPECDWIGIFCDDSKQVRGIDLSKFPRSG